MRPLAPLPALLALFAAGASALAAEPSIVGGAGEVPVLVELYTSQGCTASPTAEEILLQLQAEQPVDGALIVPLAFHVDYWDHYGWPDPFGSVSWRLRQYDYARRWGRKDVFTPQIVVDGEVDMLGSRRSGLERAIDKARQTPKAEIHIEAAPSKDDDPPRTIRLRVGFDSLPALSEGVTADILLAVAEAGLVTDIGAGKNRGKRLAQTAVVRSLRSIGEIDAAGDMRFESEPLVAVEGGWRYDNLTVVVFVQERPIGRILGVNALRLGY